jgi:two-component system response regulator FlrC
MGNSADATLLNRAFETFTEASKKLEMQFKALEQKANDLNMELKEKNAALMSSLREKEEVILELRRMVEGALAGVKAEAGGQVSNGDGGIIAGDRRMLQITGLAKGIAKSDATVLILGESGTGKELLARFIHRNSNRRGMPFVAMNCAAIPDALLESELFGYEKGAFTGADARRTGKFEMADGGTILLDEIGEMSLTLQAKLLRVLQERELDRIGGKAPVPLNIRVIATTNRDIRKEVEAGRFREDLYYRLNVFPVTLPPLRERRDDIALLAEHFLRRSAERNRKAIAAISQDAVLFLKGLPWKGNIRELENVVERAVLLCSGGTLRVEHFVIDGGEEYCMTAECGAPDADFKSEMKGTVSDMERDLIIKRLEEFNGNRTKAAKALGISLRTLRNKLKTYRNAGFIGESQFVDMEAKVA